MNTTTYEVLPIGNLDFSDTDGLKHLRFDKDSITSEYNSKDRAFWVSAKVKNDRTKAGSYIQNRYSRICECYAI